MLKVHTFPLGPIQTNCYVIEDQEQNCLIVDPGEEGETFIEEIKRRSLKPVAILLTHAHFDHIGALDAVRDAFSIPVYLHKAEADWLGDPALNGSGRYPGLPQVKNREADILLETESELTVGPFTMEVRHTPGHSPGSVCYIFEEDGFAVVGDTLFNGSVGRTDLPGGDTATLLNSIHEKILSLDGELTVYPGHGMPTTPEMEMDQNPFLHGF